jgi:hypothetical protein
MKWVRHIAQIMGRCKAFKQLRGKLERAFLCAVALYRKALIMSVITNPDHIAQIRILTLRQALKLEMLGMKRRGGQSAYAILKAEGYKGTRQAIFDQLTEQRAEWLGESV